MRQGEGRCSKSNLLVIKGNVLSSREVLRKLDKVFRDLELLAERGRVTRFLNNVKDAEVLTGLTDDIHDTIIDYQVRIQAASV